MHKRQILVIEETSKALRGFGQPLEAAGYDLIRADPAAGLAMVAPRPPDAVILDFNLPTMDALEILQRTRCFYDGPILILVDRNADRDKVEGVHAGADEYVEKPLRIGELLMRLGLAISHREQRAAAPAHLDADDIQIDLASRVVTRDGSPVRLSPREYDLLVHLAERPGRVLMHHQLLTAIWGPAHAAKVQYLRVFIGKLRQKLEHDPAAPRHLVTENKIGYRFVAR